MFSVGVDTLSNACPYIASWALSHSDHIPCTMEMCIIYGMLCWYVTWPIGLLVIRSLFVLLLSPVILMLLINLSDCPRQEGTHLSSHN